MSSSSNVKKLLDHVLDHWDEPTSIISIQFCSGKNTSVDGIDINRIMVYAVMNSKEYVLYLEPTWISLSVMEFDSTNSVDEVKGNNFVRYSWHGDNIGNIFNGSKYNRSGVIGNAEVILFNSYYNSLLELIENDIGIAIEDFTNGTIQYKVNK